MARVVGGHRRVRFVGGRGHADAAATATVSTTSQPATAPAHATDERVSAEVRRSGVCARSARRRPSRRTSRQQRQAQIPVQVEDTRSVRVSRLPAGRGRHKPHAHSLVHPSHAVHVGNYKKCLRFCICTEL